MWDDFTNMTKISAAVLIIAIVGGLACSFYNISKNCVNNSLTEMEQVVNTIVASDTDSNTVQDSPQTLIKDTDDKIDTIINGEDIAIVEKVEIHADTVVNTESYVDNTQNIVNEAPSVSYALPLTIAIIAAFVIIMFDRYTKHKKEKAAYTERILNVPLQTFNQSEVEELKEKYN